MVGPIFRSPVRLNKFIRSYELFINLNVQGLSRYTNTSQKNPKIPRTSS